MLRGEIWWADLTEARGSEPGYRRPILIIQADPFNSSRIRTVIVASITSNLTLAQAPGNVLVPARISGLSRDSVVNVSQIVTIDRQYLADFVRELPTAYQRLVDAGLEAVLGLR